MSKQSPRLPLSKVIDMNDLQHELASDLQHLQSRASILHVNINILENHISAMREKEKNKSDEYMSDIEFELCSPNYMMLETALEINRYYFAMYSTMINCILKPEAMFKSNEEKVK